MSRPRIVKEVKRLTKELKPPSHDKICPHEWLSSQSLDGYRRRVESANAFDLYVSGVAEAKVREHATRGASKGIEVMGFLLGEVYDWKGTPYAFVRAVGTTGLRSSASKVRFDPDAFPELFRELDSAGFDYIIVGWYHSHPGHTCFLSRTDLETQRSIFREPYHAALVADPVNQEIKAFKLFGNSYAEVPFAVVSQKPTNGALNPRARRRKLKHTSELGQ